MMLSTAKTFTVENGITEDTPSISVIFVMQLPSKFPRAMPNSLSFNA